MITDETRNGFVLDDQNAISSRTVSFRVDNVRNLFECVRSKNVPVTQPAQKTAGLSSLLTHHTFRHGRNEEFTRPV